MTGPFDVPVVSVETPCPAPAVGAAPENFGHKRVTLHAGYCGGCVPCGSLEETSICPRCTKDAGRPVEWPCMTAIVLGLARRV